MVDLRHLAKRLFDVTLQAREVFDIPILKVSGYGEFLLLPGGAKLLKQLSGLYERIQIITNATRLNENIVSRLADIPGLHVCVSLDGHTPELNYCRTADPGIIGRILRNIAILRNYKIPVEVNAVLTRHNTDRFFDFIKYLSDRYDRLTCYPFPVRGREELSALGPEASEKIVPLLDKHGSVSNVLPPKAYLRRLVSFIYAGKRESKCYVGYGNLGIDPDGDIVVCACSLLRSVGNVLEEDPRLALERRASHPLFHKFLFEPLSFPACSRCFTHYEIINLYLDGNLSSKEMSGVDLFGGERARRRLQELKSRLKPGLQPSGSNRPAMNAPEARV